MHVASVTSRLVVVFFVRKIVKKEELNQIMAGMAAGWTGWTRKAGAAHARGRRGGGRGGWGLRSATLGRVRERSALVPA